MEIDPDDPVNPDPVKKTYMYANTQIIAQRNSGQAAAEYFYVTDRLGSVRQVIDNTGAVVANYTYSPFGQMLEEGGSFNNSFLFTGQWFDSEFSQYYLRARQYDPVLGRFGAADASVNGKVHSCRTPSYPRSMLYALSNVSATAAPLKPQQRICRLSEPTGPTGTSISGWRKEDVSETLSQQLVLKTGADNN